MSRVTAAGTVPPGWSRNPSRWSLRAVIVTCALGGLVIATYLTLYQAGLLITVWDPFFGEGSRVVLHSGLARLLRVPDASLGAGAYLIEAVSASVGGSARWRSHPWVVLIYGLTAVGLGTLSTVLLILQPVAFGAWCTLCIASAAISINLVGPALEESLAALQYLAQARKSWPHKSPIRSSASG